jgi:hypothetical protein
MKRIALAVAGAAAIAGLAACSHTTASSTSSSSPQPVVHSTSPQPVVHSTSVADCIQQYNTWKDGNGKGIVAALTTISSAERAGDTQALTTTLKKAKPAIARAARYPIPGCADSKGYMETLLMHVNAAASTNSVSTIQAAMKGVPEIERNLTAELNRIAT